MLQPIMASIWKGFMVKKPCVFLSSDVIYDSSWKVGHHIGGHLLYSSNSCFGTECNENFSCQVSFSCIAQQTTRVH